MIKKKIAVNWNKVAGKNTNPKRKGSYIVQMEDGFRTTVEFFRHNWCLWEGSGAVVAWADLPEGYKGDPEDKFWTPASTLPEEKDEYLVTLENGTVTAAYFRGNFETWFDEEIVAWAEMPEGCSVSC